MSLVLVCSQPLEPTLGSTMTGSCRRCAITVRACAFLLHNIPTFMHCSPLCYALCCLRPSAVGHRGLPGAA